MPYDPHALTIHIDGSALRNPGGPGGIAGIVAFPDQMLREPEVIFQQGYQSTTNNRMELRACIEALTWAKRYAASSHPSRILILTDSQYVYENHKRAVQWRSSSWTNFAGRFIRNPDLWRLICSMKPKVSTRVDIEWVRGKSDEISRRVDRLAKEAARCEAKIKDEGFRESDIARTRLPGGAATLYPALKREEVIRVYRKALVGHGNNAMYEVHFDLFSEETGAFTAKHYAYASPTVESLLHRHRAYRVRFDANPRNPHMESVIEELGPS